MLYMPSRALFIHIPRTAGNSIKRALSMTCLDTGVPFLCSTMTLVHSFVNETVNLQMHNTATDLKKMIPDWDDIYKFAVDRPIEQRLESSLKLIESIKDRMQSDYLKKNPKLYEFLNDIPDHRKWIWENWGGHTTEWFTKDNGIDLGVEIIPYKELNSVWRDIVTKGCKIPFIHDLPQTDTRYSRPQGLLNWRKKK